MAEEQKATPIFKVKLCPICKGPLDHGKFIHKECASEIEEELD